MRHDSQGAETTTTAGVLADRLSVFFSPSFFPRWRAHEGRRREEEPGSTSRNATIMRTVRAFDFSRRNDYAIISRRVPFLLKRKTSPPSPSPPWLSIATSGGGGEEIASLSLTTRANRAPFLPLSLSRSIDVASFRHDSC